MYHRNAEFVSEQEYRARNASLFQPLLWRDDCSTRHHHGSRCIASCLRRCASVSAIPTGDPIS